MPRSHHLLRLPLATIRRTPQRPFLARANRIQRIPEFGSDAGVGGILDDADALSILDLPADFASKLKVVAFVVD